MYLDSFTLSALVDEFLDVLVGGRIQDVLDVDDTGIGMEIYANHKRRYLYLSADTHTPRVHLVPDRLRRGLERPTQLGLLLRRFAEGGRIRHVSQPKWERILQIEIESQEGIFTLILEPMERRSNLLLVQNGIVLDCLRRVGADENRYRVSLPNQPYQLPPPMVNKHNPFEATLAQFEQGLSQNEDPKRKLTQWLSSYWLGVSPLLAKEIAYRASRQVGGLVAHADPKALLDAMQVLMTPLKVRDWQIGVATQEGVTVAYSVYPLTHVGAWERVDTLSQAMVRFHGALVGKDAYNEAKRPVQGAIDEVKAKFRAKLASLESGLKDERELERLKQSGELILAYQYTMKPQQTTLKAQYDLEGEMLTISLDPHLSALENAQKYFDQYNRAKRAQAGVPQLIDDTRLELFFLAQLENDLLNAQNYPEIDDVANALHARGWSPALAGRGKRGSAKTGAMRLTKDGFVIWVGRNSLQNELVTFKHGNPQDLWLHARGVPGSHAVIRYDGRTIPEVLIQKVASIVAHYSANRAESRVIVDVTRVKYVKKIKGAGAGMVTYRNETTVTVSPTSEEILKDG